MKFDSLVDMFLTNAQEHKQASLTYLRNGEQADRTLTHFQLADRATRLAAWLVENGFSGQRAMLVFPAGLEFVEAFMACLCAKVIAVPVAPAPLTGDENKVRRILSILRDCQPALVLGVRQTIDKAPLFVQNHPDLADIRWLEIDEADAWERYAPMNVTPLAGEDLAFLQYTSGSTSMPKGVMLSHANILHNLAHFDHGWGHDEQSRMICWLPHFHDLGLLYGVLFPLYKGISGYLLPPASVIQKPARWLQAISRYRGTHSMGPNFIYDQCTDRIPEEECEELDLSSWRMALNAAEPIRMNTVRRFNEKFSAYGLSPCTLTGGFGLAESTCRVTAQNWDTPIRSLRLSSEALSRNVVAMAKEDEAASEMVSCGPPALNTVVKIIDPATGIECAPDRIGEVWVQSESVSSGYWKRPEENARTFGATLNDDTDGQPYMRTGDLGFLDQGELFITGRIKDMIIVGGENYYPQDAEWKIEQAHPAFKASCCAVFPVERDGEEKVVVVQELIRHFDRWPFDEMFTAVRRTVGVVYDLPVEAIVLIRPGTTSKTSSGKIQRATSKAAFLNGTLQVIAMWDRRTAQQEAAAQKKIAQPSDIESFLIARIAEIAVLPATSIDVTRPFAEYGLGSIEATQLSGELASRFGVEIAPTAFYDFPSIRQFSRQLIRDKKEPAPELRTAPDDDTVVVVGVACRFPGAADSAAYWKLLSEGGNAITEKVSGEGKVRYGGFLDNIAGFDNDFFSITPREAACLDPQQRIALEVSWQAMEDAGISADTLAGSNTGVFFGASSFDYGALQLTEGQLDAYSGQGSVLAVIANRIAYQFDLHGPSFVVDTACSSALTAVHLAARSVREGECDLAFAGAVNLLIARDWDIALTKAGMLSPDGQCKTFDASANGYVRGEGCGVLVLKRYADAIRDGDRIYGALLGTGLNQDGRSNGLTAPNGNAQEALLRKSLQRAGVDVSEVNYVEAHGTGTPLGDPIECGSLQRVLGERGHSCLVGSVKANIGHLEAAAGIAGLIKVLLALHHNAIPPQINLNTVNPLIALGTTISAPGAVVPWARPAGGRRCAITSAFGFSGTNACVIVGDVARHDIVGDEEAPLPSALPFVLTARDTAALQRLALRYGEHISTLGPEDLPHALFTSACRRTVQAARFATVVDSKEALVARLKAFANRTDAIESAFTRGGDDWRVMLEGLCRDFMAGADVDWRRIFEGRRMRVVQLPPYAFDTRSHWFQQREAGRAGSSHDRHSIPKLASSLEAVEIAADSAPETLALSIDASLIEILAEAMQMSPADIDKHRSFFELGVDSIGLTEFIEAVNKKYGTEFTPGEIFELYPSIALVAQYLSERQGAVECAS